LAATVELHVTVAVPDPTTLPGDMAPQVRLVGTVSVSETVPAKPFTAVMVMVEDAVVPAWTAAGELATIVKSWTVNVAVVEWDSVPLVPVIVSV